MSRSYTKRAIDRCYYGNNGPWYKLRRRHVRQLNRQNLNHLMANYDIEDVSDFVTNFTNKYDLKFDTWNDPENRFCVGESWIRNKWFDETYEEFHNRIKRLKRK